MNQSDLVESVIAKQRAVWEETKSSGLAPLHANVLSQATELEAWLEVLASRPEISTLQHAVTELYSAATLVAVGHYRAAFTAVRGFLELSLLSVQNSLNTLHNIQWLAGERDVAWATIIDAETGIFSPNVVRALAPSLAETAPIAGNVARLAYRRASAFVHGNPSSYELCAKPLSFSVDALQTWSKTAEDAVYAVNYALTLRHARDLTASQKQKLRDRLSEKLVSIEAIRLAIS